MRAQKLTEFSTMYFVTAQTPQDHGLKQTDEGSPRTQQPLAAGGDYKFIMEPEIGSCGIGMEL